MADGAGLTKTEGETEAAFQVRVTAERSRLAKVESDKAAASETARTDFSFLSRKKTVTNATDDSMDGAPELKDLLSIQVDESSSMPTKEQEAAIKEDWIALGVHSNKIKLCCWDVTIYCYKDSSSSDLTPEGKFDGIPRSLIFATIRNHTTLRKFCVKRAKLAFVWAVQTQTRPNRYMENGYSEADAFIAFDFAGGLGMDGAIEPKGGAWQKPSLAQIKAYNANTAVKMHNVERLRGFEKSTLAEVTGGSMGELGQFSTFRGKR